ncbi:MAG: hypothetical protein WKF81_03005 [Thermomicrobiales bacterium]
MSRLMRTLTFTLLLMLASSPAYPVLQAVAQPGSGTTMQSTLLQDDAIEADPDQDLGNGGQPDAYPREIVIGADRFLYDRMIPSEIVSLDEVGSTDEYVISAVDASEPLARIYVATPDDDGMVARYLPELLNNPDIDCLAEGANLGRFDAEGTPYVFAGIEPDLSTEELQEVGESNGQTVYSDLDASQPFPELFLDDSEDLLRFVALVGDGRPTALAESLVLAGQAFPFEAEVTDQVDPAEATRVGCAGPFPVVTITEDGGGNAESLYVVMGNQFLQFTGQLATAEATPPAEDPATPSTPSNTVIEESDPTETVDPTEEPTAEPTEEPTAEPTVEPTLEPTAEPTEEPTAEPTLEPTAEPTEDPTTEPTLEPTSEPTLEPTVEEATVEPTLEPNATGVPPTETVVATSTEEAAVAAPPTATLAPTDMAAEPTEAAVDAAASDLPELIEVQNTSYVFQNVTVDVDVTTLVEVGTTTVDGTDLRIYAAPETMGIAPIVYCVSATGEVVGQYGLAASSQPAPPAELPAFVEVQGSSYIFNEVEVNIDITTLVQVQVIVVQNVNVTIYTDQGGEDQPVRLYLVAADGQVVGLYVESSLVAVSAPPTPTPEPTEQLQPPAFVPTAAPDVPPPAIATALPSTTCAGEPGAINAQGLPDHLFNRVQLGGIAYVFVRADAADAAGTLTRIGCVGPFEAVSTDQGPATEVLYLRIPGQAGSGQQVYRFEAATTFQVQIELTDQPEVVSAGDQRYRLSQTWQPSVYSGTSVIFFVADPAIPAPDVMYAVNVYNSVVGDVIGEYRLPGENAQPSADLAAAAEQVELNPDVTYGGQQYILVNIYYPAGTTSNGFMTLFSASQEGLGDVLLGRDKRELDLYFFEIEG